MLDDGKVVIELNCRGLPTEEPDPQQALAAFNNGGIDRTQLVRRFFEQHLYPKSDDRMAVLAVTSADGVKGVPVDGLAAARLNLKPNRIISLSGYQLEGSHQREDSSELHTG